MANSTPARKKRKASEATTAAAAASRDADASQQTPMSKAEKRAEAMRRAQEYRDRLKAKKQAGSGSGDAGDAAGSSGSSSSSRPSPKKKKAAAGGKAGKKSSTSAKGKAGAKGKGKAKRSPARKSTAAASAASAATPTRATRSAGVVETPDTVPRPMPTSTGKGKSQGKRGGGRSAATGTRAAEDASSSDEDEEEDEMDVEEDVDEDKKDEDGEEASFSSDDERTARARNHGTPRKRRKVGRSPPKTKTEANGVRGDGDDGGSDAAAKRKGEAAAERKARKAEEERRAREWRERKYHSPPSSTGAGAANGGGAADATTCRAPVARTTVEARSPPRQRSAAPPRVAASAATARTSPVAPRPTTSRPRPRPVVQNGHGRTSAPRAPAATPDSIQARRREQQPLEHLPHGEDEDEVEDGEERSVLSKYPYLVILLVVCAPLGIGMFLGSSGLARPALKDFTDELGGMLAETKRNLLPGQQANSQLIRCLADSPDVPAVEHTGADEEGDDATGRTTFSANTGSGDDSPWWTKTPPALISKTATAATSKTCAGSANPLPCPRHGRCAHGFLVDCRADDAIAGRSNLFAVSEESFSDCVLSTEAKQIVSAIQGKVIDLSIEQKCNVSCRWGVGVPFISSTMTPKERCGGVDPDDVMAVRSKDDTVDYFFSVDGLVGAMDYDVTSDADSPSAGVPAISSEIVQLLAPHLDEGIIKYIPGSSAILTPRIGLTIDFVSNKLDEYLPFSCWFPAKVWECVLFLLGLVVVVFSWIFRFIRTNPGHAFYIFLTIVAAQHIYLWVERRLIIREAKIVVELVRNELAAHPEGAAVRQLHIRDDIGQTHHLYAGTSVRAGLRRKWMYRKVWKRVKNEIERDRRFRSEKRRTERGSYMEFWVVEFKSRRGE